MTEAQHDILAAQEDSDSDLDGPFQRRRRKKGSRQVYYAYIRYVPSILGQRDDFTKSVSFEKVCCQRRNEV